jgi:Protein of unknown function (DUF3157)
MKILLISFLLLCPFIFADQTATTEDGKKVILKDDGTWVYASESQAAPTGSDEYSSAEAILKSKCTKDWPDDFSTRAFCEKQQRQAVETLKKGKPSDIPAPDYATIHKKCARDWPDDFNTRAYCEKQQFDAVRELRKQ